VGNNVASAAFVYVSGDVEVDQEWREDEFRVFLMQRFGGRK
jgi:hypothetical protein